jgi:uncharacterized protein
VSSPLQNHGDTLRLRIRVQPAAANNTVSGVELDAAGQAYLKVRVTQLAEGGKANHAVAKMLAKSWRVPASSITVVAGHKDRRKILEIAGGSEVTERIKTWLGALT